MRDYCFLPYLIINGEGLVLLFTLLRMITSSLKAKLLTLFVILTVVPLVTVGLISYQKSFDTISDHNKASSMLVAEQLARDIDVLFQDTGKLLELENNPHVLKFLFAPSETYENAKEILETFELYREIYKYEDVRNITMINLYGKGISERKGLFQLDYNPLRNSHLSQLMKEPESVLIIPPIDASPLDRLDGFKYPTSDTVSIMATVKQKVTREVIGFIVIDMNDSVIKQFTSSVAIGDSGFFYVTDQKGNPIFSSPEMNKFSKSSQPADWINKILPLEQGSFVDNTSGIPIFAVFTTSPTTDWKIIGTVPLQEIVEDANEIKQLIIISVLLSIIFAITLYFFITARLTRPIQILKKKMRQAANGDLEAKVKSTGQDEITDLGHSFNLMLEKIKNLLHQNLQEKEMIQKAELRTLQAQINPHFLYNTLDSVIWMAEAGKNDQVIKLVQAFSQFFRISLNKGRDWISIKSEVDHIHNYLVIQQMRYSDILEYEIDIDPILLPHATLKMTLQPLVENAIYHGIKNKRGRGLIRISGHIVEQDILLIVEDNGIGMASERLEAILLELREPRLSEQESTDQPRGFGLYNVNQRIRLYFGERYGIEIESEEGIGTKLTVRIPT